METLIKRDDTFPSIVSKFVNPLFDDFFNRSVFDWTDKRMATVGVNLPSVNLRETDTNLEIELAAPGLKKEDFKIELDNNMLIISAEKREEESNKNDDYIRKEFNYQSFYRSFTLPEYIDEDQIEANYKDGILHIDLIKKEGEGRRALKSISIR